MMASSMKFSLLFMFVTLIFFFSVSSASSCHPQVIPFLHDLKLQCPITIVYSSPIEMDGESLDTLLSSRNSNSYTSILFYASWCPFSMNAQTKFDALASMYPQINHVKLEQSSALPSVFSRNGIHSVPSILITNKTTRVHHHGPKDLHSLMDFYQRTTGLYATMNITEDELDSSSQHTTTADPYLTFSLIFVSLKALLFLCPNIISNLRALWAAYIPRLNLSIFGESRQLLTHALHLFDVKSAFGKVKLSKSRATSARSVLASSLASVSLEKTSSPRA